MQLVVLLLVMMTVVLNLLLVLALGLLLLVLTKRALAPLVLRVQSQMWKVAWAVQRSLGLM
jgi:hypothetical protein